MYTAYRHTFEYKKNHRTIKEKRFAVGLTDTAIGAAVDIEDKYSLGGFEAAQAAREKPFPIKLLDLAVAFKCEEGKTSILTDQKHILAKITGSEIFSNNADAIFKSQEATDNAGEIICAEAVEALVQKGATLGV